MLINTIKINPGESYIQDKYSESGIYLVTEGTMEPYYMYINKSSGMTLYMDSFSAASYIFSKEQSINNNEIVLLKLQLLKLTDSIDDSEYKQLLAMLASGSENDINLAKSSITTLLNTNT